MRQTNCDVLACGQRALEAARQADRPRDAHVGDDAACPVGRLDAAEQPQQRRLAGAVAADQADVRAGREA